MTTTPGPRALNPEGNSILWRQLSIVAKICHLKQVLVSASPTEVTADAPKEPFLGLGARKGLDDAAISSPHTSALPFTLSYSERSCSLVAVKIGRSGEMSMPGDDDLEVEVA